MPRFTLTTEIAAPPAEVFAWFTDLERAAGRIKAIKKIEMLTAGPVGPGTRFKETRIMFGREATETMEIAALDPDNSYSVVAGSCGARFETLFSFTPSPTGTTVQTDFSTRAVSFFAKLFAPLAYVMMGTMKKCIAQDIEDMKSAIEAARGAAVQPLATGERDAEPMNDIPIPGKDDEGQIFRQIIGQFGAPAYIRRARAVEEGWQVLLEKCRRQRDEMLSFVRLHLATLKAQARIWDTLDGLVSTEVRYHLENFHAQLQPTLRIAVEPTTSRRVLRKTLEELRASLIRFNRRWREFTDQLDWAETNRVREAYNKYYILEKECALRSSRLARQGYRRLEPLTAADVLAILPCLEVPGWL